VIATAEPRGLPPPSPLSAGAGLVLGRLPEEGGDYPSPLVPRVSRPGP